MVERARVQWKIGVIQVAMYEALETRIRSRRKLVDSRHAAVLARKRAADVSRPASHIRHRRPRSDPSQRHRVRTIKIELGLIERISLRRRSHVKLALVQNSQVLRSRRESRANHVPRV